MKFKGTKGDWRISPSSENYISDISDNFAIAKVFNNSFIQKTECEANAKLIAAAPEMFAILKTLSIVNHEIPKWLIDEINELLIKITQ